MKTETDNFIIEDLGPDDAELRYKSQEMGVLLGRDGISELTGLLETHLKGYKNMDKAKKPISMPKALRDFETSIMVYIVVLTISLVVLLAANRKQERQISDLREENESLKTALVHQIDDEDLSVSPDVGKIIYWGFQDPETD